MGMPSSASSDSVPSAVSQLNSRTFAGLKEKPSASDSTAYSEANSSFPSCTVMPGMP